LGLPPDQIASFEVKSKAQKLLAQAKSLLVRAKSCYRQTEITWSWKAMASTQARPLLSSASKRITMLATLPDHPA
jgi:hypothetical protein